VLLQQQHQQNFVLGCLQVSEVLNVADMPTTTVVAAPTAANAQLASTQTAITAIVNKINEILQKSTLSC